MLPSRYAIELTDQQNYFGDTFSAPRFVQDFVDRAAADPDRAERIATVATNHLRSVTEEVRGMAGRSVDLVEDSLAALAVQTEADLQPEAVDVFVAEHAPGMDNAADRRRVQLLIKQGVITALQLRREQERLLDGISSAVTAPLP